MKQPQLQQWIDGGHYIEHRGHQIFVYTAGSVPNAQNLPPGANPDVDGVLIIHGFPGSSWDWSAVVPEVSKHNRIVVADLWGHGNTDKPMDGTYEDYMSLFKQADLIEAVAKEEGLHNVILVIHDMGQTVGSELMARHEEGKLSFKIHHAIVFDGSTLVNLAHLTEGQKHMLSLPDEPLAEDLSREDVANDLRPSFSKEHPGTDDILNSMIDQIMAKQGSRLLPRILRYLPERKANLERWTNGLTKFSNPESLYWGLQDPVALEAMADKIKEERPFTDLHKWPDVGHWPSIEVPERVSKAILDRLNG